MAGINGDAKPKEYLLIQEHFDDIVEEIKTSGCIPVLAQKAFDSKLISQELNTVAQGDGSDDIKASQIVTAIQAGIIYDTEKNFDAFISILREIPALCHLADQLKELLRTFKVSDSNRTPSPRPKSAPASRHGGPGPGKEAVFKKESDSGISSIAGGNNEKLDQTLNSPGALVSSPTQQPKLFSIDDSDSQATSECSNDTIILSQDENHTPQLSHDNVQGAQVQSNEVEPNPNEPQPTLPNESSVVSAPGHSSNDTHILSYSNSNEQNFPSFPAVEQTPAHHSADLVMPTSVQQQTSTSSTSTLSMAELQRNLKLDVKQKDAKIVVLQEKVTKLSEDKSHLTTELSNIKQELSAKEKEIHRVTAEKDCRISELVIQVQKKECTVQTLQKQVAEKEKEKQESTKHYNAQIAILADEQAAATTRIVEIQAAHNKEVEELKSSLKEATDKKERAEIELAKLKLAKQMDLMVFKDKKHELELKVRDLQAEKWEKEKQLLEEKLKLEEHKRMKAEDELSRSKTSLSSLNNS